MVLFLLVIIAAIALGIIGFVAHGLLWLLAIGAVILVIDLVFAGRGLRRSGRTAQR